MDSTTTRKRFPSSSPNTNTTSTISFQVNLTSDDKRPHIDERNFFGIEMKNRNLEVVTPVTTSEKQKHQTKTSQFKQINAGKDYLQVIFSMFIPFPNFCIQLQFFPKSIYCLNFCINQQPFKVNSPIMQIIKSITTKKDIIISKVTLTTKEK